MRETGQFNSVFAFHCRFCFKFCLRQHGEQNDTLFFDFSKISFSGKSFHVPSASSSEENFQIARNVPLRRHVQPPSNVLYVAFRFPLSVKLHLHIQAHVTSKLVTSRRVQAQTPNDHTPHTPHSPDDDDALIQHRKHRPKASLESANQQSTSHLLKKSRSTATSLRRQSLLQRAALSSSPALFNRPRLLVLLEGGRQSDSESKNENETS